ncbi:MAG: MCE family protein [Ignavibacteriales bacterium]|jgi:phospholipid/cholesterol/gamma-HCH transport system substrate-binding protein|nr:MCE family protein [Ignavibacteriales bacterium]MBK7266994.1 MCE family protein [Ignavibacteriales bacterium]MBP7541992.1 MCE family protein [Ignavibacteriaceae bacterium]MBP9122553.1 MCE family protein [Ignavibacteriaceae bacterium]MCC6636237.1 MCE family protein [Ignavibacteriaceae bacterium]
MNAQRKTEIKVGITAIVGIVLLVWIIGWAKNVSFIEKNNNYKIEFDNVSGLEIGDNVTINGVRKGSVESITVTGSTVLVEIAIEKDVLIPEDSKFYVTMLDLMGGKKVEIRPGKSSKLINPEIIQKGEFQFDVAEVMSFVGRAGEGIPAMMSKIDTALTAINSYLQDEEIKGDVKSGLKNLVALASDFRSLIREQRGQIDHLIKNSIKLTENADSLTSNASVFIKENQDSIATSIKNLNKLLVQSDALIKKFDGIIDETTSQKNNLGKLLYDEATFDDLKVSLKEAKELLILVKKQLKNEGINVKAKIDLF